MAMNLPHSTNVTYVALAGTILPNELRVYASAAGLCHFSIISLNEKNSLIRVAALPHRLEDGATSRHVFTLWVNTEQLSYALPWDRALQSLPTCEVREQFQSRSGCIDSHSNPETYIPHAHCCIPQSSPQEQPEARETTTLIPLPELFISIETAHEAAHEQSETLSTLPTQPTRWTHFVWLRAALAMVRRQARHTRQMFAKLDVLIEKVIAAQRKMRQTLVNASAVYIEGRLVGWRLQIDLPLMEVLA